MGDGGCPQAAREEHVEKRQRDARRATSTAVAAAQSGNMNPTQALNLIAQV